MSVIRDDQQYRHGVVTYIRFMTGWAAIVAGFYTVGIRSRKLSGINSWSPYVIKQASQYWRSSLVAGDWRSSWNEAAASDTRVSFASYYRPTGRSLGRLTETKCLQLRLKALRVVRLARGRRGRRRLI